ncbi:hypothetical protein NDU88_001337 [Pleurodeles waltl]|uniref:Uncharacterized protein n=1 Tax=Pleurodeles waltl TaxID=8319 RepID=A0AAV7Q5M3_PLEWA|nr:hypothetical protein NDU88_001337 [Pleurodeles waltl]
MGRTGAPPGGGPSAPEVTPHWVCVSLLALPSPPASAWTGSGPPRDARSPAPLRCHPSASERLFTELPSEVQRPQQVPVFNKWQFKFCG